MGLGPAGAVGVAQNQRGEVRETGPAPSLQTSGGKPGQGSPVVAIAPTVTGESARATGGSEASRLVDGGDAAAALTASYGKQIDSSDRDGGPPNLIQSPPLTASAGYAGPYGRGTKDDVVLAANEAIQSPTVTSTARCTGGTSGDDLALAVSDAASRAGATGFDAYNQADTGDVAHTVATTRPPIAVQAAEDGREVSGSLTSRGPTSGGDGDGRQPHLVANALDTFQGGVDDNDARGGRVVEGSDPGAGFPVGATCALDPMPDGFRYAACGDGVAAPCATWIGLRIRAAMEGRDPDGATEGFRHGGPSRRTDADVTAFSVDLAGEVREHGEAWALRARATGVSQGFVGLTGEEIGEAQRIYGEEGVAPRVKRQSTVVAREGGDAWGLNQDGRGDTPTEGSASPLKPSTRGIVAEPTAFHATQDPISGSVSPALGAGSLMGVTGPPEHGPIAFDRDTRADAPRDDGQAPPLRGHPHSAGNALVGIESEPPRPRPKNAIFDDPDDDDEQAGRQEQAGQRDLFSDSSEEGEA